MPDLVAPYLEWAKGAFDGCSTLNSALVNWSVGEGGWGMGEEWGIWGSGDVDVGMWGWDGDDG